MADIMNDHLTTAEEAELAGYVDEGIWALEKWLAEQTNSV